MIKKFLLVIGLVFLFAGAKRYSNKTDNKKTDNNNNNNNSIVKLYPEYIDYNIPYLKNNFVAFKEAVAFKESQGKYRSCKYFRVSREISIWQNYFSIALIFTILKCFFKRP